MDKPTTLNVQVSAIKKHPRFHNPRGRIGDTTGLQESIRSEGVLQPILVEGDGNGSYYLLGGERRLTAARLAALEVVPVILHEPVDDKERLRIIVSSNMHQEIPVLTLENGQIAGGKVYLVGQMLGAGMTRYEIGPRLGLTADAIGACIALEKDPIEVLEAVADGRLAITAYSLMKHRPVEFKLFVVSKKGSIPASYIRKVGQKWEKIKAELDLDDEEAEEEPEDVVERVAAEAPKNDRSPAQWLQRALAALREVEEVRPEYEYLIESIERELERLA